MQYYQLLLKSQTQHTKLEKQRVDTENIRKKNKIKKSIRNNPTDKPLVTVFLARCGFCGCSGFCGFLRFSAVFSGFTSGFCGFQKPLIAGHVRFLRLQRFLAVLSAVFAVFTSGFSGLQISGFSVSLPDNSADGSRPPAVRLICSPAPTSFSSFPPSAAPQLSSPARAPPAAPSLLRGLLVKPFPPLLFDPPAATVSVPSGGRPLLP